MKPVAVSQEQERELIALAQQGDRRAYGELVHNHREGVVNVVYRMCGDIHLAEDTAQETFIRAWESLTRYRPRSPLRNWLYRIATNLALDTLRRERGASVVDELPLMSSAEGPEAVLESKERAERVRQAVLSLPPSSRIVLVLREYEGLSYREIADTLGIPLGTVMSRLNYARSLVLKVLTPYMET